MKENKYKVSGIAGTIIFHVALLALLFLLALRTPLPLPGEEGVEVSLGYQEEGSGLIQPDKIKPIQRIEPIPQKSEPKEILTQEIEEAPALTEEKEEQPIQKEQEEEEKKPLPKEEPKVNPRALYTPDKSDQDETGNQGSGSEMADQGKESGSNESKKDEGVAGMGEGISFKLEGRGSILLPKPAYESMEQGKVVVKIWVNKQGKVTRALPGVQGTTITDQRLRQLARDAALKAVFTPDPNASDIQVGTITYNFLRRN